jgi:hypothetical protein
MEFDSFCENFRGAMEMVQMDHYFQCSAQNRVLRKPEDFLFNPMGLLDLGV